MLPQILYLIGRVPFSTPSTYKPPSNKSLKFGAHGGTIIMEELLLWRNYYYGGTIIMEELLITQYMGFTYIIPSNKGVGWWRD